MQKAVFLIACLGLPLQGQGAAVTPVQKVLELLDGMVEKAKKEKHEEQMQFAAYEGFCKGTIKEKTQAVTEANEKIEMLKADIQQYEADAAQLADEITKLDTDIATWQQQTENATKVRDIEKA